MKAVLMSTLFLLACNASAACPVNPPGAVPVIPNGAIASNEEMLKVRRVAEKYLLQAEAYMDCGVMNPRQHQDLAAELEAFSQTYNDAVIEFRMRANMIAGN